MNENATLLRRLIEHPRRRFFVIIGTLLVAFVTIMPAVDNYYHHRGRYAELSIQLDQMELEVARKPELLKLAREKKEELEQSEATLSAREDLFRLRGELIDLARQSGCSVRQDHLEEEQRRRWKQNDHLDKQPANSKSDEPASPYDLVTHEMLLDVVGPPTKLQALLGQIEKMNKLKKTESLSLKVVSGADNEAELVLRVQWFDLRNTSEKG